MSSISRRSLLGYSGTTAAGAVIGGAGAAQAAESDTAEAAAPSTEFPAGTLFTGASRIGDEDSGRTMEVRFSITQNGPLPAQEIDPVEIAEAISRLAVSRGWPALTFYGTPKPAPLT